MPEDRKKKQENVLSFIFPLKQIGNTFNYYFQQDTTEFKDMSHFPVVNNSTV